MSSVSTLSLRFFISEMGTIVTLDIEWLFWLDEKIHMKTKPGPCFMEVIENSTSSQVWRGHCCAPRIRTRTSVQDILLASMVSGVLWLLFVKVQWLGNNHPDIEDTVDSLCSASYASSCNARTGIQMLLPSKELSKEFPVMMEVFHIYIALDSSHVDIWACQTPETWI